ncbi:SPOR domain-containing protein [Cyclobacterium plantarum]|uniref:SPOR domain-containing protein n=1 Tax=Cyclobacterium plantarum TaxID=2716263 RepID=UPI003F6FB671
MSENKSKDHNSQSDNDEDFGLPPVNVSPLKRDAPKAVEPEQTAPLTQEASTPGSGTTSSPEKKEKKDRTNWVILFILLFIFIIGYGVYHFGLLDEFNRNTPDIASEETTAPAMERADPEPSPEPDEPIAETEEQEEPQTPQLTEIEGREGEPRYFLVVGSFIDDDLARDYSNRLNNSGLNTFLVHPYGNIHFYRLAVGQYENLDLALEAMESSQNDYEENLWVLKY